MKIDLGKKRRNEIKLTVLSLLEQYGNIKLPVPIKKIVNFFGYRLVSYSNFAQCHGLTYEETVNYFDTDDSCSDYEKNTNIYVIYYNDMDKAKIENNRVRWNIAHELGHVVLGHHKNENTRLFRNSLSFKEYNRLEEEADTFASYILVPYIILNFQQIKNPHDIARICKISGTAANYIWIDYYKWIQNIRSNNPEYKIEDYDRKIFKLYNTSDINQDKIFCLKCGNLTGYNDVKYCCICGNKKRVYRKESQKVIYKGIELDDNKKVKQCPKCFNEELGNNDIFCKICGLNLFNYCINSIPDYPYTEPKCNVGEKLDGNARFCPYCGNKTSFLTNDILEEWDSIIPAVSDEELPF